MDTAAHDPQQQPAQPQQQPAQAQQQPADPQQQPAQPQQQPEHPDDPNIDLSPTGRVILGMIAFGKRTGYDIKQFVDKTTRFFWAASYGQIYPELKRLEEQGLIRGQDEPTGGRARTVYDLTDTGRAALLDWLSSPNDQLYELRDEGMLKLFFSDASTPENRLEIVRAMRRRSEDKLAQLQTIEAHARSGPPGPYLTLQLGMSFTKHTIDWCESTERRLATDTEKE